MKLLVEKLSIRTPSEADSNANPLYESREALNEHMIDKLPQCTSNKVYIKNVCSNKKISEAGVIYMVDQRK